MAGNQGVEGLPVAAGAASEVSSAPELSAGKRRPAPWERQGRTVYALTQVGWRLGEPRMGNRWSFHVQEGYRATPEEVDAVAALAQTAPDLLDALKALNAAVDGFWNADPRNREPEIKALCEAQVASFATIARAEGRSQ